VCGQSSRCHQDKGHESEDPAGWHQDVQERAGLCDQGGYELSVHENVAAYALHDAQIAANEGPGGFYKGFWPNFGRIGSWNIIVRVHHRMLVQQIDVAVPFVQRAFGDKRLSLVATSCYIS